MIKSIQVINYRNESLTIDIFNPDESGFYIKSIEGLGPSKANILTSEVSTADGSNFNFARIAQRNVVINLGFWQNNGELIEYLRQKTYKYFPLKKPLDLIITTDKRVSKLTGYVESNEPDIFSENESCTISILCVDPYLYSMGGKNGIYEYKFSGIEPMFQFPFSNESLSEPLLNMGEIVKLKERNIPYGGDEEIGVVMQIHALGGCSGLIIYNILPGGDFTYFGIDSTKLQALTGQGIKAGDTITIDTRSRHKTMKLMRDGVEYNVINAKAKGSTWFMLAKGDNLFVYDAESGFENIQFVVQHKLAYEGI